MPTDLGMAAEHLLQAMALLPVATPFDLAFLEKHFAFLGIQDSVPTLTLLTERGWLQEEQVEGQSPVYKMHTWAANLVVKDLAVNVSFAEAYIQRVADLIAYDQREPTKDIFEKISNKPLAERLGDLFLAADTESEALSRLFANLGHWEEELGDYKKAAAYKERALEIAKINFHKNDKKVAAHLVWTYQYLEKDKHAAAALLQADLDNDVQTLGQAYADVPVKQYTLSSQYSWSGTLGRTSTLAETPLETTGALLGIHHPAITIKQYNLSMLYWGLWENERAAALLETAVESTVLAFGNDHPEVAAFQYELAGAYKRLGHYDQAITTLETALGNDLINFGEDDLYLTTRLENLAKLYQKIGKNERAILLLETVLAMEVKRVGEGHSAIAHAQHNLALVYHNIGRHAEAKTLWQVAYQNYLKNLGARHRFTIYLKEQAAR